jgi:biotin carboxyl carrier protein
LSEEQDEKEERSGLFRREAIEHHSGSAATDGSMLQLSPAWARRAYWVLIGALGVALLYSILATNYEYARGPAYIRVEGRKDLTATSPGTVASVEVRPGQRVSAGQLLVRFYPAQELAERDRIARELESQLTRRLLDLSDEGARQAITTLRSERDLAQAKLDERSVRAPEEGVVSDIRIRSGQHLNPGDVILSLVGEEAKLRVVGLLPGQYRPMLHPGRFIRLELDGFPYHRRELTIDSIGDELVGPNEIKRFVGPELADAFVLQGPMVVVEASLPTNLFNDDGRTYAYYNGMTGHAEARVRSEMMLVSLFPVLRILWKHDE